MSYEAHRDEDKLFCYIYHFILILMMRDDFSQAQQLTPQNVRDTSVNSCVNTTVLGT